MAAQVIGKHFTQIYNEALRDKRISRRARGLLAELLTHSDGFSITISALVTVHEGRDAVAGALRELEVFGYLRRDTQRGKSGQFAAMDYYVTDMPDGFSFSGHPDDDLPSSGPMTENTGMAENEHPDQERKHRDRLSRDRENRPYKKNTSNKKTNEEETHAADAASARERVSADPQVEAHALALCDHLASEVKKNGARRVKVTYAWRNAARDMLSGEDAYTYEEIREGITWAQADSFWASRTITMAKMAKHFDTIIVQARKKTSDVRTTEGKEAQKDVTRRRMEAMGQFMEIFEKQNGRRMTDVEEKALMVRLRKEIT